MKEAIEIVSATARLLNAVADTLERANGKLVTLTPAESGLDRAVNLVEAAAPVKTRKARTPKAETEAPAATPETAPQQGSPLDDVLGKPTAVKPGPVNFVQTDDEIKAKAEKLAETFVMRFKNAAPTGVERAKTILAALGVQRMAQLDRNGNNQFIEELEKQLKGELVGAGAGR
jgi:hypothetical protein